MMKVPTQFITGICTGAIASGLSLVAFASENVATPSTAVESRSLPLSQPSVSMFGSYTTSQTRVDQEDSEKQSTHSVGAKVSTDTQLFDLAVSGERLTRESEDVRRQRGIEKSSTIVTPELTLKIDNGLSALARHQFIQTEVRNSQQATVTYGLGMGRTTVEAKKVWIDQFIGLAYSTQSLSDYRYDLGGYPMIDRDYLPIQVDFTYGNSSSDKLDIELLVRYSQYDPKVYQDEYDTDVPSSPTAQQVLDYLLTFSAKASYSLANNVKAIGTLIRKAALDVDTLRGDEYVVAYKGIAGIEYSPAKNVTLGVETTLSQGQKDHSVQGTTYNYASRVQQVAGSVAVHM